MDMRYNILADFVADLQSKGRYTFSRDEVQKALALSSLALKKSLERLAKKKSIVHLAKPSASSKKKKRSNTANTTPAA